MRKTPELKCSNLDHTDTGESKIRSAISLYECEAWASGDTVAVLGHSSENVGV